MEISKRVANLFGLATKAEVTALRKEIAAFAMVQVSIQRSRLAHFQQLANELGYDYKIECGPTYDCKTGKCIDKGSGYVLAKRTNGSR